VAGWAASHATTLSPNGTIESSFHFYGMVTSYNLSFWSSPMLVKENSCPLKTSPWQGILGPKVGKPDVGDNVIWMADDSLGIMVGPNVIGSGLGSLLGSGIARDIDSRVGSSASVNLKAWNQDTKDGLSWWTFCWHGFHWHTHWQAIRLNNGWQFWLLFGARDGGWLGGDMCKTEGPRMGAKASAS